MNKHIVIFGLVFLLCISIASAEVYYNDTQSTIYADALSSSSTITDAFITITYPNGTEVISQEAMTQIMTKVFLFNFTPNETGTYFTYTNFYNGATLLGNGSSTFSVLANPTEQANIFMEVVEMVFDTFILFGVGLLLIILGQYMRSWLLFAFGGVWFLGASVYGLAFDGQSIASPFTFFSLLGLYFIYHAISLSIKEAELKKAKENEIEGEE